MASRGKPASFDDPIRRRGALRPPRSAPMNFKNNARHGLHALKKRPGISGGQAYKEASTTPWEGWTKGAS